MESSDVDPDILTDYDNTNHNTPDLETPQEPYVMLDEGEDPNNPFFNCKIMPLNYDTDEEQSNDFIRLTIMWNYEFNYDFFSIVSVNCFIEKSEHFFLTLKDIKEGREKTKNLTGDVLKLPNSNFNKDDIVHVYLIVYYDNAKCNIDFYGIFNQEIEENKLISNIKKEVKYGKNGKMDHNNLYASTGDDFVVLHKVVNII